MNELSQSVDKKTTAYVAVFLLHQQGGHVSDLRHGHVELLRGVGRAIYSPPTGWEI